jgi:hypothetical protein
VTRPPEGAEERPRPGLVAKFPGHITLATGCTWQTIYDGGGGLLPPKATYRINCDFFSGAPMEIEVDGVVQTNNATPPAADLLNPGQSRDVTGTKIRVHNPAGSTAAARGSYE